MNKLPTVNLTPLVDLQRNLSFFAARGAGHAYTYGVWRVNRWLKRAIERPFSADTATLLKSLALPGVGAETNEQSSLSKVADHFRSGQMPVFFFDERNLGETLERIPSAQKAKTVREADRVCENTFELRGTEPVKFDGPVDWTYAARGNPDWRWDLNRHVFFEVLGRAFWYTGDERYAAKFRELILDWSANNPARMDHPNWQSVFEVAFRSNVWVWAMYYFRSAYTFDLELWNVLLIGLLAHGRFLYDHLELHVPNNHLLLEAKALAFLGILLPEFKDARAWRDRGLVLLEQQINEQVCLDGVHGERSTLYHRLIAGELLELLVLMENNKLPIPPSIAERFAKMVEFELALAKPDGSLPLLGDSAAADTHLRFWASSGGPVFLKRNRIAPQFQVLQEADFWLLGKDRIDAQPPESPTQAQSAAFPDGGYYLMKSGEGARSHYLVFDCGPFSLEAMPNHGHADALSIELCALGQTWLLDPGYYSTALGLDWRNFFRGTSAHNTVVVDGLDQSHLIDARRVYRPARATCLCWISNDEFDFVDGMHNGYERLAQPITHRRQILFAKPDYWVIVDVLEGTGLHNFDLYFHMPPGAHASLDRDSKVCHVANAGEVGLAIVPALSVNWNAEVIVGATDPIQGWTSFQSGEKTPAPVLRLSQVAPAPVQFCTVLCPYEKRKEFWAKVSSLAVAGHPEGAPALTALRVETATRVDELVIDRSMDASGASRDGTRSQVRVEFNRRRRTASRIDEARE